MDVKVYLNIEVTDDGLPAIFDIVNRDYNHRHLPTDKLMYLDTWQIDAASPSWALSYAYEVGQNGIPNRHGIDYEGYRVRSLSVGDVLSVDGVPFVVAPFGFHPTTISSEADITNVEVGV